MMLLVVRYNCNGRSMGLWQLTVKSGTVYVTPSKVPPKGLEGWESSPQESPRIIVESARIQLVGLPR
ncbi:hypothetical protein HBI56_039120 [Parastagonospora nodorum]|nr:hypothetical protein HBH56_067670 [Parastagonospora nodorum]KAH3932212.1 hypothetical protein HBH54_080440 [Parastagonospora nodorum]KAH3954754.1 hypothetical protein HBH53_013970 [Parastagonospora nodorum]KAH3985989.1 hypothetical protein HBH52_045150 [Parastagonospora nodorum]KAH3988451.1 hypothetical protein HBH51_003910 [Parastagonospora nodorum]